MSEEIETETEKTRRPHRRWPRNSIITAILSEENPKRGDAAERFNLYQPGMTIQEYLDAGGKSHDVYYDVDSGFIEVELAEAEVEAEKEAA